jgi:hypothetical protein
MINNKINIEYKKIEALALENQEKTQNLVENEIPKIIGKSISNELKTFWNNFESEINAIKNKKESNQVYNVYVILNENRVIGITELDVIEPWFIKVVGVNPYTHENELEIINSRNGEPKIVIDLVDK